MITFDKPINLNGAELIEELKAVGIVIDEKYNPKVLGDELFLDIDEKDKAKAATVVAAHNGTMVAAEPTLDEKLASVGLSVSDLKAALGL